MDEARAVLARLERIEALEREDAASPQIVAPQILARQILAELRELVREAEAWARREHDDRAAAAAERCRAALAQESAGDPRINGAFTPSVLA